MIIYFLVMCIGIIVNIILIFAFYVDYQRGILEKSDLKNLILFILVWPLWFIVIPIIILYHLTKIIFHVFDINFRSKGKHD